MMNIVPTGDRHYPESLHDVWSSYEYQLKGPLRELDRMARQMFREMAFTRSANNDKIRDFMHDHFAMLWNQVAAEEEVKTKRRERE